MTIIIDKFEKPYVMRAFDKAGVSYKVEEIFVEFDGEKIQVGDFTNTEKSFIVERKRVDDLWNSMCDYRIYKQLDKIHQSFDTQKYLILEGGVFLFHDSYNPFQDFDAETTQTDAKSPLANLLDAHPNKIGWILSIIEECVRRNICFLQTWNLNETVQFIEQINKGAGKSPKLRAKKKTIKNLTIDENILTTISGIGKGRAKQLMDEYGSLKNLIIYLRSLDIDSPELKKYKIIKRLKEVFG
jgi:ERCC4-type nuclease